MSAKLPVRRNPRADAMSMQRKRPVKQIQENIDVPDVIEATYQTNYNILKLNEIVRKKILNDMSPGKIVFLKEEIELLEKEEVSCFVQFKERQTKIDNIKKKIEMLESGKFLSDYDEKVKNIIDEYTKNKYHLIVKNVSFDGQEIVDESYGELSKRLTLISKFVSIAKNYIKINLIRVCEYKKNLCVGCDYDLGHITYTGLENKCCPVCDAENIEIAVNCYEKEGNRASGSTILVDDESVNNFMKAFVRYQGLQSNGAGEQLYSELDSYFRSTGNPTGEMVRKMELNSSGYRGNTSPDMLLDVLGKIKQTGYNEAINYIGKHYFGWELPNLMHLYDKIKSHYLKTQAAYLRIPKEERERESSLGIQFRLRMHLQLLGINRPADEFKIAKSVDSMQNQRALWKRMCEECNDPEIVYIGENSFE